MESTAVCCSDPAPQLCVRLIELLAFDFDRNFIAIGQIVLVAQFHITGNFHDGRWMSSGSFVVSVCTENESTPAKNATRHDAHAHRAAILVSLQPGRSRCDGVGIGPGECSVCRIELHSGLSLIVRAQVLDSLSKIADAIFDLTSKNFHLSAYFPAA